MWEAGVHILLGKTQLAQDSPNTQDAEASLLSGIRVAQHQGAKFLELRAATVLARYWHDTGKTNEARSLLAPIHGWFTEGFDAPDLQDAQALLKSLT